MTLIDLDELKKWRMNRIQAGNCNHDDMTALGAFIDNAEKIEQKQGKWTRYYNNLICSECGDMSICYIGRKSYPYCPMCGSKNVADDDRIDYHISDEERRIRSEI